MMPASEDREEGRRWIRVHEYGDVNPPEVDTGPAQMLGIEKRAVPGKGRVPPILLLHGFTGSSESWQGSLLETLSRDRRVLVFDLPGHGAAARVPDPEACGVEAVVEYLCALLSERGIEEADWVGYSMGGRIALAAAVLRPERVRRLVLESASPGIEDTADRVRRKVSDEELAQAIEDRGMEWFVDYWMGLPLFETQGRLPPSLLQRARQRRRDGVAEAVAAALRGLGAGVQPSFWEELHQVRVQTLCLTGQFDLKYQEIGARMAMILPNGEHRSILHAGHNPHFETPEVWLEVVQEFLNRPS